MSIVDFGRFFDPTQTFETESDGNAGSDNQFWPIFEQKKLEMEDFPIQNTSLPHQDNQLSISRNSDLRVSTVIADTYEEERPRSDAIDMEDYHDEEEKEHIHAGYSDHVEDPTQIQHNREAFPEEQPIILTSENKTSKHKMYKGSRSEELQGNQAEFVVNLVNKIRKVRGMDYEMNLNTIDCTLQKDFSFYLNLRGYRNQEEHTMTGLKSTDDALHNIRNNITDYFTTEKFLSTHNVRDAIREALKELEIPSEGPNRMKNADVDRIWKVIGEDHQLIVNYFDNMIENFLHEFLENNFERTKNSLKKSLKVGASLSGLSSANLARNLSELVKKTFDSYVEYLRLSAFGPEDDQLSSDLINEIIEYVTVETEAPQAIWLMGFRQAIKDQVFSFLKQRLCKPYANDGPKKSKRVRME